MTPLVFGTEGFVMKTAGATGPFRRFRSVRELPGRSQATSVALL